MNKYSTLQSAVEGLKDEIRDVLRKKLNEVYKETEGQKFHRQYSWAADVTGYFRRPVEIHRQSFLSDEGITLDIGICLSGGVHILSGNMRTETEKVGFDFRGDDPLRAVIIPNHPDKIFEALKKMDLTDVGNSVIPSDRGYFFDLSLKINTGEQKLSWSGTRMRNPSWIQLRDAIFSACIEIGSLYQDEALNQALVPQLPYDLLDEI